jgi:hypothetical protein
VEAAIQWCYQNDCYPETNKLIDGAGYYYYARGMWDKKLELHPLAAEIARRHQAHADELMALALLVQVLSRQCKLAEAERYLPRLGELAATRTIPDEVLAEYFAALSFYWMAQDNITAVEALWQQNLRLAASANGHMVRDWLADCLLARHDWQGAQTLLQESLLDATEQKIERGIIAIQIKLIAIYLEQGDLAAASAALAEISQLACENLDRGFMALIQSAYGRYYALQDNRASARSAYTQAIDLFERLGLRRELETAQRDLDRLEDPDPVAETTVP